MQAAVALYNYLGQTENSVYIYQLKPRRTKFDFAVLLLLLLLIKKALPNKSWPPESTKTILTVGKTSN